MNVLGLIFVIPAPEFPLSYGKDNLRTSGDFVIFQEEVKYFLDEESRINLA